MHNYNHQQFQLIKKKIANLSNSNPNWKGMGWRHKTTNSKRTGDAAITLIVEKKLPLNDIQDKDVFPQSITIPGISEPVKTDVQVGVTTLTTSTHGEDELTRVVRAGSTQFCYHFPNTTFTRLREDSWLLPVSAHRGIHRPLVGGISLGTIPWGGYSNLNNYRSMLAGSGTLGGLCIDRDDNTVVGISNNHVIAGCMVIGTMNTSLIHNDEDHAAFTNEDGMTHYSFLSANDTTPAPDEIRYPVYQRSFADDWKASYMLNQNGAVVDPFSNGANGFQKMAVDEMKVGTVKRAYPLSAINNKIDVAIFALEQPGANQFGGDPGIVINNYEPYISGPNTRMPGSGSDWSKGSSNTTLTYTTDEGGFREADVASGTGDAEWDTVLNVKSGGTSNQYVELAPSDFEPGVLKSYVFYTVSFWYKWISKSEDGKVTLGGESIDPLFVYTGVCHYGGCNPYSTDGMIQSEGNWYIYEAIISTKALSEGLRIYLNTDSGSVDDEIMITKVHMIETPGSINSMTSDGSPAADGNNFFNNTLFDKTKSWKQLNLARQDEDMADSVQGLSAMDFATTAEIDSLKVGGANEGAPLFKSGRTTGPVGFPGSANYTTAVCQLSVFDVCAAANVEYSNMMERLGFVDQLAIRGTDYQPSATEGGDSGSFWYALFHEGTPSLSAWKVIGLNFAGGDIGDGRYAAANRIDNVSEMFNLTAYRGQDLDIGYKNVDIKVVNSRSDAVTALIGGNMYWQAGSTNDMGPPGYPGAGAALPSHR